MWRRGSCEHLGDGKVGWVGVIQGALASRSSEACALWWLRRVRGGWGCCSTFLKGDVSVLAVYEQQRTGRLSRTVRTVQDRHEPTPQPPGTKPTPLNQACRRFQQQNQIVPYLSATSAINPLICGTSSGILKGFVTTKSIPASMATEICSERAFAVTAITGTCPTILPSS